MDPIAKVEWSRKSFDYLSGLGLPTLGNIYPGVGHEFAVTEITDIRDFIQKAVPPMYKVSEPLSLALSCATRSTGRSWRAADGPVCALCGTAGGVAKAA